MKKTIHKYHLKVPMLIIVMVLSLFAFSQNKLTNSPKANKCTTFVYNLTTGEMRIRDICFSVTNTEHIDMNAYNIGKDWDKKNDFWKFTISISDNEKYSIQNFNASFYVYEESSEIKQYHCLTEDSDFKAIIFDKVHDCWQILMLQNDEYKILSPYTGYHYTNAFGIKLKSKSNIEY